MEKIEILNGTFNSVTMGETVKWASEWIKNGKKGYLCTVNVAILMMMRSNSQLQEFIDSADLIVADGQPLVWVSKIIKPIIPERVTGVDLVDSLCNFSLQEKINIYFLGATDDIISNVVFSLKEKYPGVNICGYSNGYFDINNVEDRIEDINKSKAQILFVGMGVPRQEEFLCRYWGQLDIHLAIPVGGSFDVIAGEKKRAPIFLQRMGLEWFFRLIQEPKRLFWRYFTTNIQFICLVFVKYILAFKKRQKRSSFEN